MAQLEAKIYKPRTTIPKGKYRFTLGEVKSVRVKSTFSKEEDGKVDKWLFPFAADKIDPETNEPYEYAVFTSRYYGTKNSSLTALLDQLVPDITPEEAAKFDTATIEGNEFDGQIAHKKEGDRTFANHLYLTPVEDAPAASAKPAVATKRPTKPVEAPSEKELFEGE
jgi:hypothetical protein